MEFGSFLYWSRSPDDSPIHTKGNKLKSYFNDVKWHDQC